MAVGNAIVDRDRLPDHVGRGLRLPALQGHDAEMMQAAEMTTVDRQRLTVAASACGICPAR